MDTSFRGLFNGLLQEFLSGRIVYTYGALPDEPVQSGRNRRKPVGGHDRDRSNFSVLATSPTPGIRRWDATGWSGGVTSELAVLVPDYDDPDCNPCLGGLARSTQGWFASLRQ